MLNTDIVVIGSGVIGSAIARELSKYELDVVLVDKNEDVGGDASKANNGMICTGFDTPPRSLESKMVIASRLMYNRLTRELDVPFKMTGALVVATSEEELQRLPEIKKESYENGIYDIEYVSAEKVKEMEPHVTDKVKGALYIPRESIIDPFLLVVALVENAVDNGIKVMLSTKVTDINVENGKVKRVVTNKGIINTKFVINAAGLYCDEIADMVGLRDFKVHPRKGQFFVLDKNVPYKPTRIVLPVPTPVSRGKLAIPTIYGNTLIGPTAEDLKDKTDKAVTREALQEIVEGVKKLIPAVSARDAITEYCGLRPTRTPVGFNIAAFSEVKGYIGLSGIRSTGVSSAPAVAKYVSEILVNEGLKMRQKKNFNPYRIGIKKFSELSSTEREELIKENPKYGHVICRCETVTEAEIIEAIKRPVGAKSVDAIKRRVRAGMGRCQGGFCGPRVIEILARELGVSVEEICKHEKGSEIVERIDNVE